MVATAGQVLFNTKPQIWNIVPMGAGTETYDFEGKPARIKRAKLFGYRTAGQYSFFSITIPGFSAAIILAHTMSQTVANAGTDGEATKDEWKGCLTVPAGTVCRYQHGGDAWWGFIEFELLEA